MVFRWLFGSKTDKSSATVTHSEDRDDNDEYNNSSGNSANGMNTSNGNISINPPPTSGLGQPTTSNMSGSADEQALGPGDSNPSAMNDLSRPLKVPLNAIPLFMVDDRPELKLSEYDMSRGQFARNVLALVHNAVRLEMADMWGDILPSLQSRCVLEEGMQPGQKEGQKPEDQKTEEQKQKEKEEEEMEKNKNKDFNKQQQQQPKNNVKKELTQADADDIRSWWSGFARFALTASLVDDFVCKKAFDDIYVGFDKELKQMEKQYRKVLEKNNVYLELAVRKMAKSVDEFEKNFTSKGFTSLVKSWQSLASILADIYSESESLVEAIDRWVRDPFQYKDLEKQAAKIFTSKKRWGDDDSKRGEMIVILCRWVGTEDLMREWMYRNLTKKELRSIDKWMDDYRDRRLAIIDRFHQKKAN